MSADGTVTPERLAGEIVSAISSAAKGATATQINNWRNEATIKRLATKLWDTRLVKTVWHFDSPVDLHEFYYPASILHHGSRVRIDRFEDLPTTRNFVLQGTIGQGKSLFLRFLACRTFEAGTHLPVFVELRRIGQVRLLDYVAGEMDTLGLEVSEPIMRHLLQHGRLVLLLDGFDEVAYEHRATLVESLESLSRKYPETRIIVTSRPDSAIQRSPLFQVLRLDTLKPKEYEGIIRRLITDEKDAAHLIHSLQSNATVAALLTSPLMVTLLVFRYRAVNTFPEHEAAFYGQLFDLLLNRHDRTKPAFSRVRKSGLGDADLERAFDALCFVVRKEDSTALSRQVLNKLASQALEVGTVKADAGFFISDITEITCLLLEETGEYRFVHKSVLEYHAAKWVAEQPDASAVKFYSAMRTFWKHWRQELRFLALIDRYRFTKFFLLPMTDAIVDHGNPGKSENSRMIASFGDDLIGFAPLGFLDRVVFSNFLVELLPERFDPSEYFAAAQRIQPHPLLFAIRSQKLARVPQRRESMDQGFQVPAKDILTMPDGVAEPIVKVLRSWLVKLDTTIREAREFVASREAASSVFDFDAKALGAVGGVPTESLDIAILTAIEVERRAVCAVFGLSKQHRVKKGGRWYWRGQLDLGDGTIYELVVAQPADMGQVEAAALTKDVLRDWNPCAAILVGIAATADPGKVKLGDVVVGKSVWYYEHGKVTPQGTKLQPEMMQADAGFLQHLVGLDDWNDSVGVARPDGLEINPKMHHGVIASGEKVIADAAVRDEIASGHRKIVAIAMEEYGFSRAIWQSTDRVQHLVLRGICDDGSPAKNDQWHMYAAHAAAAFAKYFLFDRPLEPRNSVHTSPAAVPLRRGMVPTKP